MLSSTYAEDIFFVFYDLVDAQKIKVQSQDWSPILSFYTRLSDGSQLTKNQASYIHKILEKYKNLAADAGLDYREDLSDLQWRQPFRVLDLAKRIYIERQKDGRLEICLKFPYQLKKEFDDEINVNLSNANRVSHWDHENKVRRLNFYDFNLIALYEFAVKHNFNIDESFMTALAEVEEIWQNHENLAPISLYIDQQMKLINASGDALEYFEKHKNGSLVNDALLAKTMGYPLITDLEFSMKKLVSASENSFWIKNNESLFEIYKNISGKICVILDRSANTLSWLQQFIVDADKNQISRDEIKVCFRDNKDNDTGLNNWIKLSGVGGKVESGRILIFESKPAKWLFKNIEDVKILVTNNIYPPTNTLTKEWFQSHPCVIYLGDTKPTGQRGQKIVEL
jgi:hypothetical protein